MKLDGLNTLWLKEQRHLWTRAYKKTNRRKRLSLADSLQSLLFFHDWKVAFLQHSYLIGKVR